MDPRWCPLLRGRRPNAKGAPSVMQLNGPLTLQTAQQTTQRYIDLQSAGAQSLSVRLVEQRLKLNILWLLQAIY